ncbi:MAG: L,D-transpeptidase [Chloroflexi bacterium]|nr:L,D-transpeptidase [Chloroflexota bacterium]
MNLSRWLNPPLSATHQGGRPGKQTMLIILLGLSFALGNLRPIFAQETSTKQPILADPATRQEDETSTGQTVVTSLPKKPPLPFIAPLVGPFIKNSLPNDIDRRTTAFIPQSLDKLTSITFPKTPGKWIRVDLSEQIVVAYEGTKSIRAFRVSSGLPNTPTVTGTFHIRTKVLSQTMYGGEGNMYYNLPGVKWVQYFYQDYSFHGTYWHNNFGHPMSHGCLNMTNADAKWLFDWADPVWDGKSVWQKTTTDDAGTLVIITQ